jgi:hypothetical protein
MGSIDLLEFAAVAFVVCGLAFVVWEVVAKSPKGLIEMLTDVRGFAERPSPRSGLEPDGEMARKSRTIDRRRGA